MEVKKGATPKESWKADDAVTASAAVEVTVNGAEEMAEGGPLKGEGEGERELNELENRIWPDELDEELEETPPINIMFSRGCSCWWADMPDIADP